MQKNCNCAVYFSSTGRREKMGDSPGSDLYRDALIMGPMVRVSLLPARLLGLDYGADLVYSEEVIDFKILNCKRQENSILKTVDFVLPDGTVVFQTCAREKGKVIFQMGTSNGKRALAAARKVEKDVAGIDVNMGCPKSFSLQGGMGAALLTKPDKIKEILTTLVDGLSIPVTCKIRILPSLEDTLSLVRLIESTGVKAIAVHGRTKEERPRHYNHNDYIKAVSAEVNIPVIANGGSKAISTHEDIETFRQATGCRSVMLARAALWNYSVFRKEGKLPIIDVLKEYIKYTIRYETPQPVVKYCVLRSLQDGISTIPQGEATQHAYTMEDTCAIWGLTDFYNEMRTRLKALRGQLCTEETCGEMSVKRRKSDDSRVLIEMPLKYIRKYYRQGCSPKLILFEYTKKNKLAPPEYQTIYQAEERLFHCTVVVDDVKYAATSWEKSKKCTEQAAALVFLKYNNLKDPRMMTPADAFRDDNDVRQSEESAKTLTTSASDGASSHGAKSEDSSLISCSKHLGKNFDHESDSKQSESPDVQCVLCDNNTDNVNLTFEQNKEKSEFLNSNPAKDSIGLECSGNLGQDGHGSDDLCTTGQISLDDKHRQQQIPTAENSR
ncbi:tRNA-dihydrouridine(20) synthase [NAD(P)+]-like [Liolophura sinensis]|uniref:tRNA-dihydrouridine(20) synthase [NAD(P)+]-like n=1 Tax=Liolophura sinensis TaxID=3198878 RepID=UPI003158013A